jgi:hypothetical protein
MRSAAAITMVYNESENLPFWERHYRRQVGTENCFVLDHGSNDQSVEQHIGLNIIRLPRTPFDDAARARAVSDFAASLRPYFKYVIYSDADELVVSDPLHSQTLEEFCEKFEGSSINSVGFDVCHNITDEPAIDSTQPVSVQRSLLRFNSAVCKPNIARPGVSWSSGFHGCENDLLFGNIYLFHCHFADQERALRRLQLTRSLEWADSRAGRHQRVPDDVINGYFMSLSAMPVEPEADLSESNPKIHDYLTTVKKTAIKFGSSISPPFDLLSDTLFRIPNRFKGSF